MFCERGVFQHCILYPVEDKPCKALRSSVLRKLKKKQHYTVFNSFLIYLSTEHCVLGWGRGAHSMCDWLVWGDSSAW